MAKSSIRSIVRDLGFDLIHYPQAVEEEAQVLQLRNLLSHHKIDLVFDVGANSGQYATHLLNIVKFQGQIVSFEPLSSAYEKLLQASAANPRWTVAERCAIGEANGEAEIHIANNSVSSSILPMLDSHVASAPDSKYIGVERVPVITLDSIAPMYFRGATAPFLKIDTQGFEQAVLAGARTILPTIKGIQIELSLVPLYAGQLLFRQLWDYLESSGFSLQAILPGFTDEKTGQQLQADGIFFRA